MRHRADLGVRDGILTNAGRPVGYLRTEASYTSHRLIVNGTIQNEAWDAEVVAGTIRLQSEGAPMEFPRVELTPVEQEHHR